MADTFTLSGNVTTLPGIPFIVGTSMNQVEVYIVASEPTITDTETNVTRLGAFKAVVEVDGSFTAAGLPSTADTAYMPSGFSYRLAMRYRDALTGAERHDESNWFPLTADTNFAAVVNVALKAIDQATYESLIGARDQAVAAKVAAQSAAAAATQLATSDGQSAANVTGGTQTKAALWAQNVRHPLTGYYHPEGFGAVGDWNGTTGTNDTVAVQAAINKASADGGGPVYIGKRYLVDQGLILRPGVGLLGPPAQRPRYAGTPYAELASKTAGVIVVDTEDPTGVIRHTGFGVCNLLITGAGLAAQGIRFRKTWWSTIRAVTVKDFQDQGIEIQAGVRTDGTPFNVGADVNDVLAVNCVVNRSRSAAIAAVEINGGDTKGSWIEAATSSPAGTVSDANLYITGILIGSANGFYTDLIGELTDVGIRVTGDYNKFSNCRADLNNGHGWLVTGNKNTFASCTQIDNGQAAVDTYTGARVSGKSNSFAGLKGRGARVKYHIEDLVAGGPSSDRNAYDVGCTGEFTTAMHYSAPYAGSGRAFPPHDIHPANGTTSIDVSGTSVIVLDLYSAPASITALTGGVNGQSVTLHATAAQPITLVHSTAFRQRTAANRVLIQGEQAMFRLMNNQWWEVGAGPSLSSVNMTSADVAMTLLAEIVWCNNPAARTLTLPDAAALPNRRRIIRSINVGTVTIASAGGTVSTTALAAGASLEFISNGTNWYAI